MTSEQLANQFVIFTAFSLLWRQWKQEIKNSREGGQGSIAVTLDR